MKRKHVFILMAFLLLVYGAQKIVSYGLFFSHEKKLERIHQTLEKHTTPLGADTLQMLSTYPDCEVRSRIILDPDLSSTVLNKMMTNDPDLGVKRDARNRFDFLRGVTATDADHSQADISLPTTQLSKQARRAKNATQLQTIYFQAENLKNANIVLQNLAANCFITPQLAQKLYDKSVSLSGYSKIALLAALAANPNTPTTILLVLANEKDLSILRGLAGNPKLPLTVVEQLAQFPDCKTRKKITCLPDLHHDILSRLARDTDDGVALEAEKRLRNNDEYLYLCQEVKKLNPSCSEFYGVNSAAMRLYPNTSRKKVSVKAVVANR